MSEWGENQDKSLIQDSNESRETRGISLWRTDSRPKTGRPAFSRSISSLIHNAATQFNAGPKTSRIDSRDVGGTQRLSQLLEQRASLRSSHAPTR